MTTHVLVTILLLGLSVEGLVLCPFVTFGLTLSDRWMGLRFLLGRITGIVLFGALVSLLGVRLRVDGRYVNLGFGLFLTGRGLYQLWRDGRPNISKSAHRSRCEGRSSARRCSANGRGFGFGLLRGLLTPGRKYVYLAPLLIGVGWAQGVFTSLVFGVASSVYLLLGVIAGGALLRLSKYRHRIECAGAAVLVILGVAFSARSARQVLSVGAQPALAVQHREARSE